MLLPESCSCSRVSFCIPLGDVFSSRAPSRACNLEKIFGEGGPSYGSGFDTAKRGLECLLAPLRREPARHRSRTRYLAAARPSFIVDIWNRPGLEPLWKGQRQDLANGMACVDVLRFPSDLYDPV